LVLDWVMRDDPFVIALLDNGTEEMGWVLDLPLPDKVTNKRVRHHLETSLPVDLRNYKIDDIRDIEQPGDETVGDKLFHLDNFKPFKQNLIVKLRSRSEELSVAGDERIN